MSIVSKSLSDRNSRKKRKREPQSNMIPNARLAVLLSIAALVESIVEYPECAIQCESVYTGDSTDTQCNMFDYKCLCTNKVVLQAAVCCLYEHCSDSDRTQAAQYARTLCNEEGYIIPTGFTSCAASSATAATATGSSDDASKTSSSDSDSESASSTGYKYGTTSYPTSYSNDGDDSSSDSSSSSHIKHKTNTHTLKTGLGVGLGVGIPLIAAIAGFLLKKKRKQNNPETAPAMQQMPPPGGFPPPPQGYLPSGYPHQMNAPPGYPPQGYPPQEYPPQTYLQGQPPAATGGFVDPLKTPVTSSVTPVSNVINQTNQHEMMGNIPQPRHELSPQSVPSNPHVQAHNELPINNPPTHTELPLPHPHTELPTNHPPTHNELP
ncbi:hypothetical protein B0T10DRAFT_96544 [Thelonectria olida]|uniref:CFEM domain-containing protein n=1 Tax=Thelonectria olida TaxID=1576542 RepID=A0A9P8W1M7_9HYPO|nr:hypothetical protein B0T10DRAFT_96544 [Thelonectria olida]